MKIDYQDRTLLAIALERNKTIQLDFSYFEQSSADRWQNIFFVFLFLVHINFINLDISDRSEQQLLLIYTIS